MLRSIQMMKLLNYALQDSRTAPVTTMSEMDDPMKDEALAAENKSLLEKVSKLTEENQYLKNEIEMKDVCLEALKKESISPWFAVSNVRLVDGLKYNLISISQLTDAGHKVKFDKDQEEISLATIQDQQNLWHRRLGHVHMDLLRRISSHDLVRGLPKLKFKKVEPCSACQLGKQVKTSFIAKNRVSTTDPLQLLHLDLFGPERYVSLGGKNYAFVIIDDYSRFTWVLFLRTKDEVFVEFKDLITNLETKYSYKLKTIRSDHGGEFEKDFITFCKFRGITHEFSSPRTPQHNGVVERKNRTLHETSRTLLHENKSSGSPKTPDIVSNVFSTTPPDKSSQAEMRPSHLNETTPIQFQADNSNEEDMSNIRLPKSSRTVKNHPPDNLLTDLDQGISTRSRLHNLCALCAFVAEFEPKNAQEAVADEHWIYSKRFALENITPKATPMSTSVKLIKDEQDADYAGLQVDRKSTSVACEFLGDRLVAWHSKKQTYVALPTAEGEYIAAGSCRAQILWMQQTLQDFGISFSNIPIYCDNTSAINISKNAVMHSRTKHIDVRHHFLRDNVSKGNIELIYISTEKQRAYIFTKPLAEDRFCIMRRELGNIIFSSVQGSPMYFKADLLEKLTGVFDQGWCLRNKAREDRLKSARKRRSQVLAEAQCARADQVRDRARTSESPRARTNQARGRARSGLKNLVLNRRLISGLLC
ncbi:hypothetical protein AgCh_027481 [Apium graveolens]